MAHSVPAMAPLRCPSQEVVALANCGNIFHTRPPYRNVINSEMAISGTCLRRMPLKNRKKASPYMMPLAPICHPGFPIRKVSAPHPIQMAKRCRGLCAGRNRTDTTSGKEWNRIGEQMFETAVYQWMCENSEHAPLFHRIYSQSCEVPIHACLQKL